MDDTPDAESVVSEADYWFDQLRGTGPLSDEERAAIVELCAAAGMPLSDADLARYEEVMLDGWVSPDDESAKR